MNYQDFLKTKAIYNGISGFDVAASNINKKLFDFQKDIVRWSLKKGRACLFEDCGLGKTPQQLVWAEHVAQKTNGKVLILAPLAVSRQTVREGEKFGIEVNYARSQSQVKTPITITNYEMLSHFDASEFNGIVLDESSILKSYTGTYCNEILNTFSDTPYRLACTATPAPNDLMELGNHAEFVGAMTREEMLAMFFVHDGGETQKWRLKGHAVEDFWTWVCSWAIMVKKPSDLGYQDGAFTLPMLNIIDVVVDPDHSKATDTLFIMDAETLQERQSARRDTVKQRAEKAAEIINGSDDSWLIWCDRNDESTLLKQCIDGAVEITGSHKPEYKEEMMIAFTDKKIKRLVTKPSIAGWGMNWQHCNNVVFVGLSDSYEQFYQAVRRSWRFGQKNPVNCYVITSSIEGAVVENIKRKEKQAQELSNGMLQNMVKHEIEELKGTSRNVTHYVPKSAMSIPSWIRSA